MSGQLSSKKRFLSSAEITALHQDEGASSDDDNAEDANTPGDYPDNMSKDEAGREGQGRSLLCF